MLWFWGLKFRVGCGDQDALRWRLSQNSFTGLQRTASISTAHSRAKRQNPQRFGVFARAQEPQAPHPFRRILPRRPRIGAGDALPPCERHTQIGRVARLGWHGGSTGNPWAANKKRKTGLAPSAQQSGASKERRPIPDLRDFWNVRDIAERRGSLFGRVTLDVQSL